MRIRFTKMQGAGNDFVVLDETRARLNLSAGQIRFLADRRFGVGADQVLLVRAAHEPGIDFEYAIFNADGQEVEQCGNGARCFVRYVREHGLTTKAAIRVKTLGGVIEPRISADGRITVNMGTPVFDLPQVPFNATTALRTQVGDWEQWQLRLHASASTVAVAVLSVGNPHAVHVVDDVETAPVASLGPLIERHAAFPRRVNAGFMQIVDRSTIRLRVYERGAGETLACGSGACAAVVAGVRLGLLDQRVQVHARGGELTVEWSGEPDSPVMMTGPAITVFEGEIDLPDLSQQ